MNRKIIYGLKAKQKLLKGINTLAEAVGTTLGPKGRNVTIAKSYGSPTVTHDGVTVAKEIELKDPFENMGAQMITEAASKTNDLVGDGTTTATVLTQAMITEGLKMIQMNVNPMTVKSGMTKAVEEVIRYLNTIKIPITSLEDKQRVATISSQDTVLGELIGQTLHKIGKDGVVTIEESRTTNTYVEEKTGMIIDKGYISPYFVTEPEKMTASIENAYILVTDKKLSSSQDAIQIIEKIYETSKNLLIIADDVEGEALATFVINKVKGLINVVAIKAPGFGDRRREMLEDISTLTGATLIDELGKSLSNLEVEDFGRANKVIVSKEETIIVGGAGETTKRVEQIKREIEKSTSEYDKEKLQERLAKLTGGVAVIYVGASTETELKEKKYRVEDAVNATKAAIDEGVVIGGGVALLKASKELEKYVKTLSDNDKVGARIVLNSLSVPFKKILTNAGEEPNNWINRVKGNKGFDVKRMIFTDLIQSGVFDPVKVTISALTNALSVTINVLTTEALIVEENEKQN